MNKELTFHEKIANDIPAIKRGQVWCKECGHTEKVNGADCLRNGWPKHCGYTMTINSPTNLLVTR